MEILYAAVEEKQTELTECLQTLAQRKEDLKQSVGATNPAEKHNFTQSDNIFMLLEDVRNKERKVQKELVVLEHVTTQAEEFDDMRELSALASLALDEAKNNEETLPLIEAGMEKLSEEASNLYHDHVYEYKRLKRILMANPSDNITFNEMLETENKIAKCKIRRDLFTMMTETLRMEISGEKQVIAFNKEVENHGLSL